MSGPNPIAEAMQRLRSGDVATAERICQAVLLQRPGTVGALMILGMIAAGRGNLDGAAEHFGKAVLHEPRRPDVHFNLGLIRARQGRSAEALASFESTLTLDPSNAGAQKGRAEELLNLGRHREAAAAYDTVLSTNRRDAESWYRRGMALSALSEHRAAAESYQTATAIAPQNADYHNAHGAALITLGTLDDAVEAFTRAIAIDPEFASAYSNRGVARTRLQHVEWAEVDHNRAVQLDGADGRILANYVEFLHRFGRNDEAVEVLRRLNTIDPLATAIILGNVLADQLKDREALAAYDRALALQPFEPFALWCRAILNLRSGDLEEGFRDFEWWPGGAELRAARALPGPEWNPAADATPSRLFVYATQGLGDIIQFARYIPLIAEQGHQVTLEAPASLVALLSSLHPSVAVIPSGGELPAYDAHCELCGLPHKFGTVLETIPARVPYLHSVANAVPDLRARVAALPGKRVGLCWSGNPMHERDARRSIPLSQMKALLDVAGVSFVSLQKDIRPSDQTEMVPEIIDITAGLPDMNATAAIVEELDLVITVDTAIAHLAGALGKPVWILLPHAPDWRWLLGRDDSPWYPTARLFRQVVPGDWNGVLLRVQGELSV